MLELAVANEKRRTAQRKSLRREIDFGLKSSSAGVLDVDDIIRRGQARLAKSTHRRRV